jgi:hypothetical protein
MKTTGQSLTPNDVVNLKRGDIYLHESTNSPCAFDHYSDQGNIINTNGKLNKIENVRWLTPEEKAHWSKLSPDLFKIKPLKKLSTKEPQMTNSVFDIHDAPEAAKETPSFMDNLKKDTVNAGYRVAATQVGKLAQNGIVIALEKKGMGNDKVAAIKDLLESEVGTALIQVLLGYGLNYVPGMKNDPRVERLAEEFRVSGTAVAGNLVVGSALEYVLPAIQEAIKSLPELPSLTEKAKTRVGAQLTALPKKSKETLADAIEEVEEEKEEVKKAQA